MWYNAYLFVPVWFIGIVLFIFAFLVIRILILSHSNRELHKTLIDLEGVITEPEDEDKKFGDASGS